MAEVAALASGLARLVAKSKELFRPGFAHNSLGSIHQVLHGLETFNTLFRVLENEPIQNEAILQEIRLATEACRSLETIVQFYLSGTTGGTKLQSPRRRLHWSWIDQSRATTLVQVLHLHLKTAEALLRAERM